MAALPRKADHQEHRTDVQYGAADTPTQSHPPVIGFIDMQRTKDVFLRSLHELSFQVAGGIWGKKRLSTNPTRSYEQPAHSLGTQMAHEFTLLRSFACLLNNFDTLLCFVKQYITFPPLCNVGRNSHDKTNDSSPTKCPTVDM